MLIKLDKIICRLAAIFFESPIGRETARQFAKFSMIGVVNTIIDFGLYFFLTRILAFFSASTGGLYLANCLSFLAGTTFSFYANRHWTFGMAQKATVGEAGKFYATTLSGLAVNNFLLYLLVGCLGINDLLAKVCSTVFSTIWNFSWKRLWVFAQKAETPTVKGQYFNWTNL